MTFFIFFNNKTKTFRARKTFVPGSRIDTLHKKSLVALETCGDLQKVIELPADEDLNEWIAIHIIEFFNRLNVIYASICEHCTPVSCPTMSAGPRFEFLWNTDRGEKPVSLPAREYITLLLDWIESTINDSSLFPITDQHPFPKHYIRECSRLLRRMHRFFAHIYFHHFQHMLAIAIVEHVNTCYKHFYLFVKRYRLLEPKEFEPLADVIRSLICD